jgi:glycosyltransferase involved in cell wall biosynthesis
VYSHINTAFYVGTANKAYFKKYGLKEKQLIFAPHAIDNERFLSPRINDALKLRARFSISDEEILIIFAGKLETVKNPMLLLTAFKNLNQDNVKLLFVGNGALEKELKESSHSESLKNKIHFLDFQNQSQMPTIYQACDLFCLPSISETWGLAVNEAMACSKAILVSDKVGCGPDLVIDGVNGTIFRSNDKDSLVAKLNSLCINRDNLAMLGKKSAKIISNWTFDKQVEALQSALQNI